MATRRIAWMAVAIVLAVSTAQANTIYVDANCPGGNGSEADPYCSIQTAIDNAVDTDEIIVAPGTYFETINFLGKAIWLHSSDGPEVTIIESLVSDCCFSHPYPGCDSPECEASVCDAVPSCCQVEWDLKCVSLATCEPCTRSLVRCNSGEGPDTVLDGFTIAGQFSPHGSGAGMIVVGSSPTVINCTFTGNQAIIGGGMRVYGSPTVIDCIFSGNTATYGGGIEDTGSGGMTVTNCTFSGNTANNGGGMWNQSSNPTVTNCILWGNSPNEFSGPGMSAVTYSDIQGGWPGIGNIDADPLFVDPVNGDYRLSPGSPSIAAGHNSGLLPDTADLDGDGDVRELTPLDLDGNPRFADDPATQDTGCGVPIPFAVDMGAYESPGMATSNAIYWGDLDADRVVGIVDLLALLADWGRADMCLPADLDLDGEVGIIDFFRLLQNWTA